MNSSLSISKIAPALLRAQKAMGDAKKDAKNPFFKSSYADLNAVREAAIPVLNAEGIIALQPTVHKDGKNFVQTMLIHESGEFVESETEILSTKPGDPQAAGSGISYARRYGLQSFLNIGAVDDDGEAAMGREKANKTPPASAGVKTTVPQQATGVSPTPTASTPISELPKKTSFKKPTSAPAVTAPVTEDWS